MYYRRLKFCIIYLALNRGCFEAVLMKNTPRPLGVKMKIGLSRNVEKLEASKLTQGFEQIEQIEYFETFGKPYSQLETIRMIIALIVANEWTIKHFNILTTFSNEL
jgi:hypothetical protein